MELRPVTRRQQPSYPTRDILRDHPELLRLVPERWRHNALALGVLTGTLSLLSACRQAESKTNAVSAAAKATRVAPLFIHGEGRGAVGCIVENPPCFLSEAEARAVIRDEAKKAGIAFANDGPRLGNVSVPITSQRDVLSNDETDDVRSVRKRRHVLKLPLSLDGADEQRQIAFEYVSQDDYKAWSLDEGGPGSTVSAFDIKSAALELRAGLSTASAPLRVGVFYDPMATKALPSEAAAEEGLKAKLATAVQGQESDENWWDIWGRLPDAQRRHSAELLRQQVRDFIAWLKAQGVI